MKYYLAGPMTGLPNYNREAFEEETSRLHNLGYDIVSPAEINLEDASWCECLRKDLRAMLDCQGIILMPGWQESRGASLECYVASALEMRILNCEFIKE